MIRAMAVVLPLIFTAPVDYTGTSTRAVASYEAFFHDASDGAIVIKLAYNGPRGYLDGPAIPNSPGSQDTVWVVMSEAVSQQGIFQVVSRDSSGNASGPSNLLYVATMVRPDSLAWVREHPQGYHEVQFTTPGVFPGRSWRWTTLSIPFASEVWGPWQLWTVRQVQDVIACPAWNSYPWATAPCR